MVLKVQFEFLFVGRNEEGFVKNYFYELDEKESGERARKAGRVFVTLEMIHNLALGEEIGELIFHTLKESFFRELEEDPYVRFEESLKSVNKAIFKTQDEKEFKFASNLNVVVGAVVGDELFLSQAGDAEAYLVRRKHVSVISEGLSGEEKDSLFVNIASGTLERSDDLIFSSTRLLRYVSKSELGNAFSEGGLEDSLERLKELIGIEIHNKTGIMGIRVEGVKEIVSDTSDKKKPWPALGISLSNLHIAGTTRVFVSFVHAVLSGVRVGLKKIFSLRKEKILAIIIFLALVLVIGVVNVRKHAAERERLQTFEADLVEVQTLINDAGVKGSYDKNTAGVLLGKAEEKALAVLNSGLFRAKATQFLEQIEEQRDTIDTIVRVDDLRVVADLAASYSDISSIGLISASDALYVFGEKLLYRIVLNKVDAPLTIDENETVIAGTYFDDRNSLLFLTASNRVIEFQDGRFSFMDTDDGNWHGGKAVKTYSNKMYLLSPAENQIWRYVRRRDKYGVAESYNVDAQLQNAVDFAIDGSVYFVSTDGSIKKMYTGNIKEFGLRKEPLVPLKEPMKIFTELDLTQVYILEASKKRVLVYNKDINSGDLVYNSQYVFETLEGIRDFYVDKTSNTMYLLDKAKVYELRL